MGRQFSSRGFTLLELIAALLIAALLFTLGGPSVSALHDAMQYREAVRHLVSAVKNGRRDALASGQPMDLLIDTVNNRYALTNDAQNANAGSFTTLPLELEITVVYAVEVSPSPDIAAIRFYPAGGSSGGEVSIVRESGSGVHLTIDWLLGDVTQEAL